MNNSSEIMFNNFKTNEISLDKAISKTIPEDILINSDLDITGFLKEISKFQLLESIKRGEKNTIILDVYEEPNFEYLKNNTNKLNVDKFINFGDIENNINNLCYYSNIAYNFLFNNSLCGLYVNSVINSIEIYESIYKKKNQWNNHRKNYIKAIAPAAFWIFQDDYLSARLFCRTITVDGLISLVSDSGFFIDDNNEDEIILPLPIRNRLLKFVSKIPSITNDNNILCNNNQSMNYHAMVISGIKTLSSLTII